MPQASDELRARWADKKGNITDKLAIEHLLKRGFVFTRGGIIVGPPALLTTPTDYSAIDYLADEWDYDYDLSKALKFTNDEVMSRLTHAFGSFFDWPILSRVEPRWWQFTDWLEACDVNEMLEKANLPPINQDGRDAYHEQVALGQGYDDAVGFRLRCWCAGLGQPFLPVDVSFSAISHDPEKLRRYGLMR